MITRIRFDIGWRDLAYGLVRCVRGRSAGAAAALEAAWGEAGDAIACLSVRSAFDLALAALALPRGSEILVSAVTIPHMVQILEHHGLVAVPIDLDLEHMALRGALEDAITPNTRGILVAHLFGARIDLAPIVKLARHHGLLVFEDLAQAFDGPRDRGHPGSDLAMFSFGPIKHRTALGGALVRVRSPVLLAAMRARHASYPVQPRAQYARRVAKYGVLKLLSLTPLYTALVAGCRLARVDHDALIGSLARGFASADLFAQIRRRPCAALAMTLRRRLSTFDELAQSRRLQRCRAFANQLSPGVFRFGRYAQLQTFWLFPVSVDDPQRLTDAVRRAGFDATRSQSALCIVEPPRGRPGAPEAVRRFAGIVYIPFDLHVSRAALDRLARTITDAATARSGTAASASAVR